MSAIKKKQFINCSIHIKDQLVITVLLFLVILTLSFILSKLIDNADSEYVINQSINPLINQ